MLRRESVRLTLLTTGLLLQKHAHEVARSFDDVIVSIDGPEQIHDAIRRVPGAFRLIDAGVKAIRDISRDFRITTRTTVQNLNFAYLRATVSAAKALDLNGISFLAVDLTSQAFNRRLVWPIERQSEVGLGASEVAKLEEEIRALLQENSADISSGFIAESPEKLWRIVRHFRAHLGLEQPDAPVCNAPWTSAVVEADGTLRPCFFHAPIGSLVDQELETAINGERALQFRSMLDIPTNPICQRCVCSLNYRS